MAGGSSRAPMAGGGGQNMKTLLVVLIDMTSHWTGALCFAWFVLKWRPKR